jgi:hypothetical protein
MMLRLGAYDPNEEMLDVYYSSGADVTDPNEEMLYSYYSSGAGVTNPIPGAVQPQQQPAQQPPVDSGAVYKITATAKAPPDVPWGLLILGAVALVMFVRNN